MSDSAISAVAPPVPQGTNAIAPLIVKIETLPANIPLNSIITGLVIATGNNQTSIQTGQGVIVLQTALNAQPGQEITLKLQPAVSAQANVANTQKILAEILTGSTEKITGPGDISRPATTILPPETPPLLDPVNVHEIPATAEYEPLQALILKMPDGVDRAMFEVMTKSLLQLPMQQNLPAGLQEGFEKFSQLVNLLSQSGAMPQQATTKSQTQQNILSTLLQLFQPAALKNPAGNPLLNQMPHMFTQLQTIQPGENLSPNILVNIKEQILALLNGQQKESAAGQTATPEEKPSGILQSLLPKMVTSLVEKTAIAVQSGLSKLPQILPVDTSPMPAQLSAGPDEIQPPAKSSPLFTLPAVALVLGEALKNIPQLPNANLVLMAMPLDDGNAAQPLPQHLLALIAPQAQEAKSAPLLPGTLLVAAIKPQTEQFAGFAAMPRELAAQIIAEFPPVHPSLGENWPALDDLWQQLSTQAAAQPAMQNPLQQIIPSPSPQQFPPAMLFFLSVLKNDLTSQWLPEKHLAGLEKLDKAALIKTLTQDLQAIKARMEDVAPSDSWRPLPVPLQVGDQLMRLQWFYRHPDDRQQRTSDDSESDTPKKRKTRFLVNVPKTSFGDMQIDGLVQEKNLDLILRTENTMASEMETTIRGRYAAVLEATGMIGAINFQSGRDHYVHV